MPRPRRIYPAGVPQHVYNRGNRRQRIFLERADYLGFLRGLALAAERTTVQIIDFCLMTNHWHLVLSPTVDGEISTYVQVLMNEHIRDLLGRRRVNGGGHFYGGRHKNVPIFTERQLWVACRYVEANPLVAGLVDRAEHWEWSSLSNTEECCRLARMSPLPKPSNWLEMVNQPLGPTAIRRWKKEVRQAQKAGTIAALRYK